MKKRKRFGNILKAKHQPCDLIGDIHGHADTLRALLDKLGYVERGGFYAHPERTVIFLGDFIDRGPKIQETLQIVRAMVDNGSARAVMGNHEYNAIAYHTPDGNGGHLRSHTEKDGRHARTHRASLEQVAEPFPSLWEEHIDWFKKLPLFLDLGGLRIVHACWDESRIAYLNGDNRLTDELLFKSAEKGTPEYWAIEVLLKGKEIALPDGHTFTNKEGNVRHEIRVKWWLGGEGHTYHSLCLPECETVPKVAVPTAAALERWYAATELPVIVGHYWLPPEPPALLAPNIACVDYSVAKEGGRLVAYRWDGERLLDAAKFVGVSRLDRQSTNRVLMEPPRASSEMGFRVFVDDNYHFMDEDERYTLGDFATHDEALAACKQIVDDFLLSNHQPGMTAENLCNGYTGFGEDPWIANEEGHPHFSAWDYAKSRCDEICGVDGEGTGGLGDGN